MMKGTGNFIYIICDWIMRLAIANLLWVSFSLLGAGVFGIFPSSVAVLALIKEWISGRRPSPIPFVWNKYRRTFKSANVVFLIGSVLLFVTLLNLYISLHFQGIWFYLFISSFIFLFFGLSVILLLCLLPLSEEQRGVTSVKRAVKMLFLYPGRTILLCIGVFLLGLCIRMIPGLIPLYSVNLIFVMVVYLFEIQIMEATNVKDIKA